MENILEKWKEENQVVLDHNYALMEPNMKENTRKECNSGKESYISLMEQDMKDPINMDSKMGKELNTMETEKGIKENGKMVRNQEKV